jgi:hypothetical protein
LHDIEGDKNDHRLVEKEEGITGFPTVPESLIGEIQKAHPDVEKDYLPTPGIDTVQDPRDIKTWRAR